MPIEAIVQGGLAGICAGLLWLLWQQQKTHADQVKTMVPHEVWDNECKRGDRQADLLAGLATSVAVLVDRRAESR
jgi:hypothetical protein